MNTRTDKLENVIRQLSYQLELNTLAWHRAKHSSYDPNYCSILGCGQAASLISNAKELLNNPFNIVRSDGSCHVRARYSFARLGGKPFTSAQTGLDEDIPIAYFSTVYDRDRFYNSVLPDLEQDYLESAN